MRGLKLSNSQFELISDWVHFAIISLIETDQFSSDIQWMAEKLNITTARVRKALRNLISFFTLPVDVSLIPEAKLILRNAQDQIDALMKTGHKTEVYKMNMYLYPLTEEK